jgi:hypothetical protein
MISNINVFRTSMVFWIVRERYDALVIAEDALVVERSFEFFNNLCIHITACVNPYTPTLWSIFKQWTVSLTCQILFHPYW